MKKIASLVFFTGWALLVSTLVFLVGVYAERRAADPYPVLTEVRRLLEQHFIRPLPDGRRLEYGAVHGLVSATGDPYTRFVEPQPHELESQSLAGEFGGIGVEISKTAAGWITLKPYHDSPAAQAGLQAGDILLAVDATTILTTTTVEEAAALIRGEIDTPVTLKVRRADGTAFTTRIVRQRIEIPSVEWQVLTDHPDIGLIKVFRFSGRTPAEVARAGEELRAQGCARLALDLRNNGGGILESAVDVAALFLDDGVVMYETQRNAPERVFTVPGKGSLADLPLAVLVNHNTASAAEIVAGALLDRDRAPLIGQTTYGKGSVQLVYELSDKSSLHVTAYLWYTPSRRELDQNGLPPTIPVEPAADGTDAELAKAVEYLSSLP